MSAVILNRPIDDWLCLGCGHTEQAVRFGLAPGEGGTRMHRCPKAGGMLVPLVGAGTVGKLVVHEREDYAGAALARGDIQTDANGRVVASAEVVRDDGNDVVVYAPTARVTGDAS